MLISFRKIRVEEQKKKKRYFTFFRSTNNCKKYLLNVQKFSISLVKQFILHS